MPLPNYLDDFMAVWPPNSRKSVQTLKFVRENLSISLALEQTSPSFSSEFLGFGINTIELELQVFQDKVTLHSAANKYYANPEL